MGKQRTNKHITTYTNEYDYVTDIIGKAVAVLPPVSPYTTPTPTGGGGSGIGLLTNQQTIDKGAEVACRLMVDLGLTNFQAAAIVGNLSAEGFPYPDRIQGGGVRRGKLKIDDTTGYGWAQWTSRSRQQGLANFASSKGINYQTTNLTDEINYGYLVKEFKDTYLTSTGLKSTTTLRSATEVILKKFERPRDQSNAVVTERTARAQQFLSNMNCTSRPSGVPTSNTPTPTIQGGGSGTFNQNPQGPQNLPNPGFPNIP